MYTGQPQRDAHLRSADFFDVEHHPTWTFVGSRIHQVSGTEFEVTGDLTVRGVTRPVTFDVTYLGQWNTRLGGRRGGTTVPGGAPVSPPRRVSIGMTSV
ncbi:YceI family protein [Streptomyces sp. NPDC085929]|uniref:YceI family protein n=1 Tax=Streptomyces sp. NPDC085929 TaxID=3365739 RepID=UPI0037D0D2CC